MLMIDIFLYGIFQLMDKRMMLSKISPLHLLDHFCTKLRNRSKTSFKPS